MQNFIIDTSVFVLSEKSEDINIEKNNLNLFKKNIASLLRLQYDNSITVSYMNRYLYLNKYLLTKSKIQTRIKELINKDPECSSEFGGDSPLLENWDNLLFRTINPWKDENGNNKKGKIGIFNNIPDRDNDPSENYVSNTYFTEKKYFYPKLPYGFFNTFKKNCGYIAFLNSKYHCFDNNFIVLGEASGTQDNKNYKIKINKGKNIIKSCISIVGIQKTKELCPPKLEFKNLTTACEKAINEFSKEIDFGEEINNDNIQKDLFLIAGPPEKIYRYLETLCNISGIIAKESLNIQNNELVELLNSYGLLCSPEDKKYEDMKCKHRQFMDKSKKKKFFNIHLKPSTFKYNAPDEDDNYTLASKMTLRIYLDWDDSQKRFFISWIGRHPSFCHDCINTTCKGYKKH